MLTIIIQIFFNIFLSILILLFTEVFKLFKYYKIIVVIPTYGYYFIFVVIFAIVIIYCVELYCRYQIGFKAKAVNLEFLTKCILAIVMLILIFLFLIVISLIIGREAIMTENVVDFGFFKVYKIYFEEWELISFCENELIRQNKQNLGIDLPDVVSQSNNSLELCKQILQERIYRTENKTFMERFNLLLRAYAKLYGMSLIESCAVVTGIGFIKLVLKKLLWFVYDML